MSETVSLPVLRTRSPGLKNPESRDSQLVPRSVKPSIENVRRVAGKKQLSFVEIYDSVKGEGTQAGVPMTFVRFATCNLACDFCDTPYNRVGFRMTEEELVEYLKKRQPSWIIFTGGEPMVQLTRGVTSPLKLAGIRMAIETNGMIFNDAMFDLDYINISPKVAYDTPDNPIPVEKRIAPQLVKAVIEGHIKINEIRHIICGPQDDVVELPEGVVSEWTTISPLMYDTEVIDDKWVSGMGHRGMRGEVDQAAFNRCIQLVCERAHLNYRLSVQVHKFVGVR